MVHQSSQDICSIQYKELFQQKNVSHLKILNLETITLKPVLTCHMYQKHLHYS